MKRNRFFYWCATQAGTEGESSLHHGYKCNHSPGCLMFYYGDRHCASNLKPYGTVGNVRQRFTDDTVDEKTSMHQRLASDPVS